MESSVRRCAVKYVGGVWVRIIQAAPVETRVTFMPSVTSVSDPSSMLLDEKNKKPWLNRVPSIFTMIPSTPSVASAVRLGVTVGMKCPGIVTVQVTVAVEAALPAIFDS